MPWIPARLDPIVCLPRPPRRGRRPPARRGFTLAEVLVALLLLAWGALALVAASAGAVRAVGAAESQERAALTARDRLEQLASGGCSHLRDSAAVDPVLRLREQWAATPTAGGVRLLTATVAPIDDRHFARPIVLHRLMAC